MATASVSSALAKRQAAARLELQRRHRLEVDKFKQYVEGEIVSACQTYATQGSDVSPAPHRPPGRIAPGACEYLVKQRFGNTGEISNMLDRSRPKFKPDSEFAKTLVTQKIALIQRQQYEAEALQAAQKLEWKREVGDLPNEFPMVEVAEFSLEDCSPAPEDLRWLRRK
eukprot:comp7213_c0_seq1/m.2923 comp7213_c0_seq1/g.2923  ORF comp7213_c0_seq1/g.2923 comp7213_c0_seq1/m.2923 type:complete len:169 (-) comp7213_c0_seq1:537-1043(-)